MTKTLYPHQSPVILGFCGIIFLFISTIVTIGNAAGWFLPTLPPLTSGIWCTTMTNPKPLLLGIDPIYISVTFGTVGIIFILLVSYTIYSKIRELPPTKYCPYCKRRL